MFQSNKINKFLRTSTNNQLAPLLQPSTNLRGKKILMPGFDTAHWQFSITPKDKFYNQLTLIRLILMKSSTINNSDIINTIQKNNTSKWNVLQEWTF